MPSTPRAPVHVIPGGFHCSDLLLRNAAANPGVQRVVEALVAQVRTWVAEFYGVGGYAIGDGGRG